MYIPSIKDNAFYIIKDGFAEVYMEIPPNPVLKSYTVIYEDGAISKGISLRFCFKTNDLQTVESKYLKGLIR